MATPITAGEAWQALGADPAYAPSRPDKRASGNQLHTCNILGILRLEGAAPRVSDVAAERAGTTERSLALTNDR